MFTNAIMLSSCPCHKQQSRDASFRLTRTTVVLRLTTSLCSWALLSRHRTIREVAGRAQVHAWKDVTSACERLFSNVDLSMLTNYSNLLKSKISKKLS